AVAPGAIILPIQRTRRMRSNSARSRFPDVRVTSVPQVWRFNAPDELFDAIYNGGVRIKAILRAQSSGALEAIRTAAREAAKNFTQQGVIELPMPAILASAVKPR